MQHRSEHSGFAQAPRGSWAGGTPLVRVLAIDLGTKRVGIAKSDPFGMITQPHATLQRRGDDALVEEIARICEELEVAEIVVGLPLHMDGREGEGAADARRVAGLLETRIGCRVVLWDERLSTVGAERLMTELGVKTRHKRSRVDQFAAEMILQSYLASRKS